MHHVRIDPDSDNMTAIPTEMVMVHNPVPMNVVGGMKVYQRDPMSRGERDLNAATPLSVGQWMDTMEASGLSMGNLTGVPLSTEHSPVSSNRGTNPRNVGSGDQEEWVRMLFFFFFF